MNEAIDILTFLGIPGDKIQRYQVIAESNNNYILTLIDVSYGLPVFERMRKRVLYI